jgi:DNA-binding response OmpR family regulator
MSHILIVEDEERIASFVEMGLRAAGFATTIVTDGRAALQQVRAGGIDLVILDLGLPVLDGLAFLRELRGTGHRIPVVVLTARDRLEDTVTGFEHGADDYLTKPFRFEELLVRVRARLRPDPGTDELSVLRHADLALDLRRRTITVDGRTVELSAREFALAEAFLRHPGQVLSHEQLLDQVWGLSHNPGSNVVEVYIGYLRRKLGRQRIETVRGMGYRLR